MDNQCSDCGAVFANSFNMKNGRCVRCARESEILHKQEVEKNKELIRGVVGETVGGTTSAIGGTFSGLRSLFKGLYLFTKWMIIVGGFAYVYLGKGTWTLLSILIPSKVIAAPWDMKNNKLPWKEKDWILGLLVFFVFGVVLNIIFSVLGIELGTTVK